MKKDDFGPKTEIQISFKTVWQIQKQTNKKTYWCQSKLLESAGWSYALGVTYSHHKVWAGHTTSIQLVTGFGRVDGAAVNVAAS